MRLATLRVADGTVAARIEDDHAVGLPYSSLDDLLALEDWRTLAAVDGPRLELADVGWAPPVLRPEKILCVGLNYAQHIQEMGRELPTYPTLFAKFTRSLIGPYDDIVLPAVSDQVDWEAELCVVIGRSVRHADATEAQAAIAGYTVMNDVSVRDYQNRTLQWLQGKTFESSTPVGPWLVTTEPGDPEPAAGLSCAVDGETMQRSDTGDLVFGPAELVAYVSSIITLVPGDLIATGTPGGVGHARKPARYLRAGNVVTTTVEGIGELRNTCRAEPGRG